MRFRKILRYSITLAVVIAAIYFFYLQFRNNADLIGEYDFSIKPCYIFISIFLGIIALLSGPLVWRIYVNNYLHEKLNLSESYALYCTSTMFKYIPGKFLDLRSANNVNVIKKDFQTNHHLHQYGKFYLSGFCIGHVCILLLSFLCADHNTGNFHFDVYFINCFGFYFYYLE